MNKKDWVPYVLPAELEPYRKLIYNTGGNTIEDLMSRYHNDKNIAATNLIVFTMAASIEAQIFLLLQLRKEGLLG